MTREEAERERDRLAAERPESTWLVHEATAGEWEVARVALKPQRPEGAHSEGKPKPPQPDDPRSVAIKNIGGPYAG
jgi:hypothetical protein